MARDDTWFKNTTWTPEIAAAFEKRFARARGNRRQPLSTQAGILVRHGLVDEGVALYRRAAELEELKPDERTMVLGWLGLALIDAGRFDDAVEAARAAVRTCPPSARQAKGARTPEEILAFALRQRGGPGDDAESLALLANEDPYRRQSLETLRERCPGRDHTGHAYTDAEDLAEIFSASMHESGAFTEQAHLDALAAASPAALEALDRLWCLDPPMFGPYEGLRQRFLFEAGGYVGRVLVRAGGTWQPATAPIRSKVFFNGRSLDPFAIAYEALFRFKPLARSFAEANAT